MTADQFHTLADAGHKITIMRTELSERGVDIDAARCEILIQLQELKQQFYSPNNNQSPIN